MNIVRPSEIVRSIEDGAIGAVQLLRATAHGIKRDVLIEYTARQLAREHKRERTMTNAQRLERAQDLGSILRRVDELIRE